MKARVILLAVSVSLGLAVAQPPDQQTQPPAQQTQPPAQVTPPQQTTPQKNADTKAASQTAAPTAEVKPAEMQTKTYKGVLVDMSCAPREAKSATPAAEDANSANRASSDSGADCKVSSNSSEMGMKMKDGRTVRFDLVGNQRAQDNIKNNKRWNKDLSAGKEIHATVLGAISGEKLIVSSIQ